VKPALKPGGHCLMVLDAPVREWRKGYGTERGFLPWQVMLDWAERVDRPRRSAGRAWRLL
jgi:hypothetical protein